VRLLRIARVHLLPADLPCDRHAQAAVRQAMKKANAAAEVEVVQVSNVGGEEGAAGGSGGGQQDEGNVAAKRRSEKVQLHRTFVLSCVILHSWTAAAAASRRRGAGAAERRSEPLRKRRFSKVELDQYSVLGILSR